MSEIKDLTNKILEFRDKRDWSKYHKPKDLAMCLSIEASELLELFLWKSEKDKVEIKLLKEELADILYSALLLAKYYDLDVKKIILEKLKKNNIKYPVKKAKGKNNKYNKL